MSAWDDLIAAAVIGTGRRGKAPQLPDEVSSVLSLAPLDSSEMELLRTAGCLAPARRAAQLPHLHSAPMPTASRPEIASIAPAAAGEFLSRILQEPHKGSETVDVRGRLIVEWLARARVAGVVPPPELLPNLLDACLRGSSKLRSALAECGSQRIAWLAEQNLAWEPLAPPPPPMGEAERLALWSSNLPANRLRALQDWRQVDPPGALQALAENWDRETGDERGSLIQTLRTGLSMTDEPFLEAALDDTRLEVRATACGLLARLPESRLAGRMSERAAVIAASVSQQSGDPVALNLDVNAALIRDCGGGKSTKLGEIWEHMARSARLSVWAEGFGGDADRALTRWLSLEMGRGLAIGWFQAAVHQGNAEWASLLVRKAVAGAVTEVPGPSILQRTMALVPRQERERLLVDATRSGAKCLSQPFFLGMLELMEPPWRLDLSLGVFQALRMAASAGLFPPGWNLDACAKLAGTGAAIACAEGFPRIWPANAMSTGAAQRARAEAERLLIFRAGMARGFGGG